MNTRHETPTQNPNLDLELEHLERLLAARRSLDMSLWSAERLAQHADRAGCVAILTRDLDLPGKVRIEFAPREAV